MYMATASSIDTAFLRVRVDPLIVLALIMFISGTLSIFSIPGNGLWLDELFSYYFSTLDIGDLLSILRESEANMSLYYAFLHIWITIGHSEIYLKALSIIFALASLFIVYNIGVLVNNRQTGLIAALLLGLNPFFLRYAQEIRSYSLTVLLTTLAALSFLNVSAGYRSWKMKLLFVASAILSCYAHFFSILVLAALYISMIGRPRTLFSKDFMLSALAIFAGVLPLVWFVLTRSSSQTAWVHPSTWRSVLRLFYELTAGLRANEWMGRVILGLFAVPCCLSMARVVWPGHQKGRSLPLVSVASWLVVPILLTYIVSLWKPLFVSRYLIVSLPALMLFTAFGLEQLRHAVYRWGFLVGIVGLMVVAVFAGRCCGGEDWRGLYSVIAGRCTDSASLYFFPSFLRVTYPYHQVSNLVLRESDPQILPQPLSVESLVKKSAKSVEEEMHGARDSSQLWVILAHDEKLGPASSKRFSELQHYLDSRGDRREQWDFSGNLRLLLYESFPDDAGF